jgi:glyceraldehyde 3-phosphate dehydrogenase
MKNGKLRIGINGFGRIGRSLYRLLLNNPRIEVAHINDVAEADVLVHLLKYDSVHGRLESPLHFENGVLRIESSTTTFSQALKPSSIDWSAHEVDIVVECSGRYKSSDDLRGHLQAGVKKVILSVPPVDHNIPMVVLGVNDHILEDCGSIVSNASCTTNSAAPLLKIIRSMARIEKAYITTVHSYTSDQRLHDAPHTDLRRARAAAQSIVPTTTGAAKAITGIFPDLEGHIGGCGIRVPVPDGSLTDITFILDKELTEEEINAAFRSASENELKGILGYTEDPIVSLDVLESPYSVLFDAQLTSALGKMVKVVGWYDNEYGYAHRLIDLIDRCATSP